MALEVSLCWTLLSLVSVSALISVPDLTTPKCYISEGDLNIGVIAQVYDKGPGNQYCGNQLENEKVLQGIEAVVWAINQVNDEASPLLRGIRLGYVVLDNCGSELTSVAQALAFVPQENVNDPASSSASQASFCRPRDTQFDVVGVVGFEDGALARAAANVLALFNIPVISSQGSPEDVEGAPEQPREHDYLFYMTPPDELQGQAMVQLLRDHNWTYSALIYSEGSSGEKAAAHIQRLLPRHNMCLAMSVMMETGDRSEEFQLVLDRLVDVENARVVMLFLTEEHVQEFYDAVSVKQLSNKYIWVGSETLVTWTGPEASGGFAFLPQLNVPKSFSDYYRSRTPVNNERNPWMRELWSMMNNCTWTTQDPLMSCESQAVPNLSQAVMGETARYIDSVYVLVEALDEYITASCRSAFNDPSVLPSCLDGTELLPYIQNIDILGRTGQIQFGEDGVAQTGYLLQYFDSNQWTTIGEWSKADGRVSISDPSYINWNAYSGFRLSSTPRDRAPPSVCSLPCHTKEYQVQGSSSCCWSCNRCRADHIINAENSSCVPCAFAMWPDAATSRVCEPIPDDYMGWGDSQAIAFWFFSIVGMLACIAIGVVYFLKRTNKLIVACNIELSVITLVGAFLTYMTMLLLLGKPNSGRCGVERFGFDNALAFLVVPLMVKMNRSFRIYQASRKSKKTSVVFVGRASQLAFCIGVLLMQIILATLSMVVVPPEAVRSMPYPDSERLVELHCHMPITGIILPLLFNLFMVVLCCYFGISVFRLRDNFYEGRCICIFAVLTWVLWLCFMPTYFSAKYQRNKVISLEICLLFNATFVLCIVFLPRLYAVYFVKEEDMHLASHVVKTHPSREISGFTDSRRQSSNTHAESRRQSNHANADANHLRVSSPQPGTANGGGGGGGASGSDDAIHSTAAHDDAAVLAAYLAKSGRRRSSAIRAIKKMDVHKAEHHIEPPIASEG